MIGLLVKEDFCEMFGKRCIFFYSYVKFCKNANSLNLDYVYPGCRIAKAKPVSFGIDSVFMCVLPSNWGLAN